MTQGAAGAPGASNTPGNPGNPGDPEASGKPGPTPTPVSQPFWDAVERGRLLLQRCRRCGHHQHYPRALCAGCWSQDIEWTAACGRGRVWTHTAVHRPGHPAWQEDVPYVLALVELAEGPRLMSNVIGVAPGAVQVGMPVEAVFPHLEATATATASASVTGTGTGTGTDSPRPRPHPRPHSPLLQFSPVQAAPSPPTTSSSPAR